MKVQMHWVGLCFLIVGGVAGCASSESAVESGEKIELESTEEKQTIYPEWFTPGIEGAMASGELIGYGRAISNHESRSLDTARENALQGLRYRVDRILEAGSPALESEWSGSGSMHLAFRNAVASLDLTDVTWRTEVILTESRGASVVAEARVTSDEIANQLAVLLDMEPVRSLFDVGSP